MQHPDSGPRSVHIRFEGSSGTGGRGACCRGGSDVGCVAVRDGGFQGRGKKGRRAWDPHVYGEQGEW